ncbi:MAG: DNA/RNA non-specific endonuclease [Eudoraea sp.]|nr:DNA/RNA non-specific endonuclease [Eudoraea sp.]
MRKQDKNKLIYTVLILFFIVAFWVFENFYTPDKYASSNNSGQKENYAELLLPTSTTGDIIVHDHFTLSYHERYEQAEWVAYSLRKSHLTYDDRQRPYFIEDPKVRTKSADWRNYRGSGFDRGHLCPAGDMRFSETAYNQTFYTSNISPQRRDFNAGVWNRLEMQVRSWCKRYGDLQVMVGGILERGLEVIGDEDVAIPDAYFKVIARGESDDLEVIAFLIPHRESQQALVNYVVSVDEIERLTGIDFLGELPDEEEDMLESSVSSKGWTFR